MPYCFGRRLRHAPPLSARALPRAAGARVLGIPLLGKDVRDPLPSHPPTQDDISKRIEDAISPKWLRIGGYWYPRGGIPIDVFYQTGEAPEGLWLPDQGVQPYRGRG